jgi:hypothetical protein
MVMLAVEADFFTSLPMAELPGVQSPLALPQNIRGIWFRDANNGVLVKEEW